ncbi:hypothetical protein CHL76_08475 [Marinococcus halophilus]|uniref:Uncharacterized protein n=1 Tax=Marinococcus halophilus TaxID=1371 RepID=A0A510Y4B5_MARHA|nr:hypothetical protein [Marinococcus halophilus]OZT80132.1 hypothetical protein CHL76_08475 [Marinococcus halophilus]GEK58180.1 hypothetical protein MHA01_10850 [Marinococcus halophilus]
MPVFSYSAPAVGKSEKLLEIEDGHKYLGTMRRYFSKNFRGSPIYDVNVYMYDAAGDDKYVIEQLDFGMVRGYTWGVYKNDAEIGKIKSPRGLFKNHRIDVRVNDYPGISIKAKTRGKHLILDENENKIGETSSTNSVNKVYQGEISALVLPEPDILFYGVIHTFWCGMKRN